MKAAPLLRFADRILERFTPRAEAQAAAAPCGYQYRCVSSTCYRRVYRQRRECCLQGGEARCSSWVTIACDC